MDPLEAAAQPIGPAPSPAAPVLYPDEIGAAPAATTPIGMETPLEQIPEPLRGAYGEMQTSFQAAQDAKLKNLESGYTPKYQENAQRARELDLREQRILQGEQALQQPPQAQPQDGPLGEYNDLMSQMDPNSQAVLRKLVQDQQTANEASDSKIAELSAQNAQFAQNQKVRDTQQRNANWVSQAQPLQEKYGEQNIAPHGQAIASHLQANPGHTLEQALFTVAPNVVQAQMRREVEAQHKQALKQSQMGSLEQMAPGPQGQPAANDYVPGESLVQSAQSIMGIDAYNQNLLEAAQQGGI